MTTEQPPAQKRSLASKGMCWTAHVRGVLNETLIFCSTTVTPDSRFLCVVERSGTPDVLRCPKSSQIDDFARPHAITTDSHNQIRAIPSY
jgi:hypothetical protein